MRSTIPKLSPRAERDGERSATPELDIVGVRREGEDVDAASTFTAESPEVPARSSASSLRSAPTTASRPNLRTYGSTEYARSARTPPGRISSASRFTCAAVRSSARPAAAAVFSTSFSKAKLVFSRVVCDRLLEGRSRRRGAPALRRRARGSHSRGSPRDVPGAPAPRPRPSSGASPLRPRGRPRADRPSFERTRAVAAGTSATRGRGTVTGGTIPAHEKSGQAWAQYAISAGPRIVAATGKSTEAASGRVSAEKEGSQAPLAKRSTTSSASNDPSTSLEREPRARLEKEKALAPDAREERQGGGVGRDLERMARGLERLVALREELLAPRPSRARVDTASGTRAGLSAGFAASTTGHRSAEEPAERRREGLEESPPRVRGRRARRAPRRPAGRARRGHGLRDERLGVDADRERSDGRPVFREGGGVGADVHRAVRTGQDERA